MSRNGRTRRSGFTLVELLVVIGIIALLISILLPALNKARAAAETATCLARMRGLGQAVAIYQAQYRGSFPPPQQWCDNTSWGGSRLRGFTLWGLLGVKAGTVGAACPTMLKAEQPRWSAANDGTRAHYSYRYNSLLGGVETNANLFKHLPHATIRPPAALNPNPMKSVKNASETLMFLCSPQLVAFQTNDLSGSDRGMGTIFVKVNVRTVNNVQRQWFRSVSPIHGTLKESPYGRSLTDGTPALAGLTNVLYCDGSARTLPVAQGQFNLTHDPANKIDLTDGSANGNIRAGNDCLLEGTRLDPAATP